MSYVDEAALQAAHEIEDIFCQHHSGGRLQRLARIQVAVFAAITRVRFDQHKQAQKPAEETGECASRSVGEGAQPAGPAPDLVKPSGRTDGGYSVDPEAQKDSVDRTGRRNGSVGRSGAAAVAETSPKPGHSIPRLIKKDAVRSAPVRQSPPVVLAPDFDANGVLAIDTKSHVIRGPAGDAQLTRLACNTVAAVNDGGLYDTSVLVNAGPWPGEVRFRDHLTSLRAGLEKAGAELIEQRGYGWRLRLAEAA